MPAGRPIKADPGSLYAFAHQFYWDFRRLSEGTSKWFFNKKKQQELEAQIPDADIELSEGQKARAVEVAEQDVREGKITEAQRKDRIREVEEIQIQSSRDTLYRMVAEESREVRKVRPEPEVLEVLLDPATTPERIREICKDAVMTIPVKVGLETKEIEVPAWPLQAGSPFPGYLSEYAEQFVAALHDPRFPSCDIAARPSTRLKQFWFLSRALAGALFGVTPRTAVNLVGSLRPEEIFEESNDAKPERRYRRRIMLKGRH
jgi:hypothetical protein